MSESKRTEAEAVAERCPLATKYGDTVCRDGMLWALTYSDSAPPDQRQCVGPCPRCTGKAREKAE